MARFQLLAMWMLAHQRIEDRRKRLAWHDERGEGDDVRKALTDQHAAWSKLTTSEQRKHAYAEHIRRARKSDDPADQVQANAMDIEFMERLAS